MNDEEEILGYISRAYQGWGTNYLSVFFTTRRIIIAKTASVGTLFLRGAFLAVKHIDDKAKQLEKTTPESILMKDKKNYAIDYVDIIKMQLKKPSTFGKGKIVVETAKGKQKINITNKGIVSKGDDFSFTEKLAAILDGKITIEH